MIDIHSHILAGLDDGPQSAEDTAAMLSMAAADGITDIVATPHANVRYSYDRNAVERTIDSLRSECPPNLRIHPGCEFHLNIYNIREAVKDPTRYVINGTQYILVELPAFFNVSAVNSAFSELKAAGMIPIITEPERHAILQRQPELLNTWLDQHCLVQITAQSVLGHFGPTAKDASAELLRSGSVHFVASDAHDREQRPPVLSAACREIRELYGSEVADALFTGNCRKLLEGRQIANDTAPSSQG